MSESKLTDNEIIKAFECCADINDKCPECPLKDKNRESCVGILMSNALDLINRQKAEIERLDTAKGTLICDKFELLQRIKEQDAEIERLKYLLDYEEKKYDLCAKRFYKKGAKEFAERLKQKIIDNIYFSQIEKDYFCVMINNRLKEMEGAEE